MFPVEETVSSTSFPEMTAVADQFNWVFWILMGFNLCCFAVVRSVNPRYFRSLFTTAIFNRQLLQNAQEELRLFGGSSILLNIAYFNCVAVVVSRIALNDINGYTFVLMLILLAFAAVKLLLMQFLAFAVKSNEGIYEHTLNHLVYFQTAAIILTPVFIFTYFVPAQITDSVNLFSSVILLIIIFLREVQTLGRILRRRIGILYIILYLCTLELLPFVLLIKVFVIE